MNFIAVLVAALVPLVVGFVWYNPKVLGTAWMKASGVNEEKIKGANMAVIFGVTIVFAFLLSLFSQVLVIHQLHFGSILAVQPDFKEPGSVSSELYNKIMELYKHSYRTFKHGAFHGTIAGILFALPVIGTNALFERKGFKYIAINAGYWILTLALMGGVLSAFE